MNPPMPDDVPAAQRAAEAPPPFEPPADYEFEPELVGPAPRAIPPQLHEGRFVARRRQAMWGLLTAGACCIGAGLLPIVHEWGLYIVPLEYINWIGGVLLLGGAITPLRARFSKGPYRYVEEGVPIVVRIRAIGKVAARIMNGQEQEFHFVAVVDYRQPQTGGPMIAELVSSNFGSSKRSRLTTSFRVGDYVTAVYLPNDPQGSLRLYGFLELRPGLGVVDREDYTSPPPWKTALTVAAVGGLFFLIGWNIYAFSRYSTLEMHAAQLAIVGVGGALLGGAWGAAMAISARRGRQQRARRNLEAVARGEPIEFEPGAKAGWFGSHGLILGLVIAAGLILLSGITVLCWACTLNAWFDSSPGRLQAVNVLELIETTHKGVIREYTIEYRFLNEADGKHKFLSNPTDMAQFNPPQLGGAWVRDGWLGWPWVSEITPTVPLPKAGQPPAGK